MEPSVSWAGLSLIVALFLLVFALMPRNKGPGICALIYSVSAVGFAVYETDDISDQE